MCGSSRNCFCSSVQENVEWEPITIDRNKKFCFLLQINADDLVGLYEFFVPKRFCWGDDFSKPCARLSERNLK